MKINKSIAFLPLIFGAFEGEENKIKNLVTKMGFNDEQLQKIETGEISIDDAVKERLSSIETSLKERIGSEVENSKKSEIFLAAHAKNEKLIADIFGLDYDKYKETEKDGRAKRMLEDALKAKKEEMKLLEEKYNGADQQKVKELDAKYQRMLDEQKAMIEALQTEKEKAIIEAQNQVKGIKKENAITEKKAQFLSGIKNPAFGQKQIDAIMAAEMMKYQFDVEETDKGIKVWVLDRDGKRVQNPKKPTENLAIESFFENIKEDYEMENKSNGGSNTSFELPNGNNGMEHGNKAYQEQMNKIKESLKK